jgi:hypothetical protein
VKAYPAVCAVRDGEVGGGDVALARDEGFQQGFARHRDEDQVQLEVALEAFCLRNCSLSRFSTSMKAS